jgi:hypothetical protein
MFLLTNVIVYHLHHFFTSKPNLDEGYPSLKHFRWAASKRSSLHETLLQIAKAIKHRTILPAASVSPSMSGLGTTNPMNPTEGAVQRCMRDYKGMRVYMVKNRTKSNKGSGS